MMELLFQNHNPLSVPFSGPKGLRLSFFMLSIRFSLATIFEQVFTNGAKYRWKILHLQPLELREEKP